jgi:hypothetical protein
MKEKCACGKDAVFLDHYPEDKEKTFLCQDCAPPEAKRWEGSEEGFLRWAATNPLRDNDNEPTSGI